MTSHSPASSPELPEPSPAGFVLVPEGSKELLQSALDALILVNRRDDYYYRKVMRVLRGLIEPAAPAALVAASDLPQAAPEAGMAESAASFKSRVLLDACSKWSGAQKVEAGDIIEWLADFRVAAPLQADAPKVAEAGQVEAEPASTPITSAMLLIKGAERANLSPKALNMLQRGADALSLEVRQSRAEKMAAIASVPLAATPSSPQAPAPQAVVGEASKPSQEWKALDILVTALREIEWCNDSRWQSDRARIALWKANYLPAKHRPATVPTIPSPAPSVAPHQGADALREALAELVAEMLELADNWPGIRYSEELAWRARAALEHHQALQQGEQHE